MLKMKCLCEKSFSVYPYRKLTAKFCSSECQKKYRIFKKSGYKCLKGSLAKSGNKNPMWGKRPASWKHGLSGTKEYQSFMGIRRKVAKKNNGGVHTLQEWKELKKQYGYMCLCCKEFEPKIKLTEDHIIPLTWGGTDDIDNIQPLCFSCNSRKGNRNNNKYIRTSKRI